MLCLPWAWPSPAHSRVLRCKPALKLVGPALPHFLGVIVRPPSVSRAFQPLWCPPRWTSSILPPISSDAFTEAWVLACSALAPTVRTFVASLRPSAAFPLALFARSVQTPALVIQLDQLDHSLLDSHQEIESPSAQLARAETALHHRWLQAEFTNYQTKRSTTMQRYFGFLFYALIDPTQTGCGM